jgi:hypothetical protein
VAAGATQTASFAAASEIDPTKKSDYSTSGAMKPGSTKLKKSRINTSQTVTTAEFSMKKTNLRGSGATITVEEAMKKQIITPDTRRHEVLKFDSDLAAELPSTLPRIRRDDFQKMIREYERGNVPSNPFENAQVVIGGNLVSIGDINRFANPRRALESQGIPVTRAASDETKETPTPRGSVVIPGMEPET